MYHIDSIVPADQHTTVSGWIVDGDNKIRSLRFREKQVDTTLDGFGQPSPDLVGSFGSAHANARFTIHVPSKSPNGFLIFALDDSREIHIPLGQETNGRRTFKPILHQLYEGRYIGKFQQIVPSELSSIILSQEGPESPEAIELENPEIDPKFLKINAKVPSKWNIDSLNLYFKYKDGSLSVLSNIGNVERFNVGAYEICEYLFKWIDSNDNDLNVIEIGSRARSGITRRHRISERHSYTGVDLKEGPNVDIVADAHELSRVFEPESVDAVFGMAIFEHLAMPWKVALELNKIMKLGGRAMFFTHQAWPLHEVPFDFFRFSKEAWSSLFNEHTGFKILNAAVGDPARLLSELQTNATHETAQGTCYLVSSIFVEKTSKTQLSWEVPASSIYKSDYPM